MQGKLTVIVLSLSLILVFSVTGLAEEELLWRQAAEEYYAGNFETVTEMLADYEDKDILDYDDYKGKEYLIKAEIELLNINQAEKMLEQLEEKGYNPGELYWQLGRIYLNKEGHFDAAMFTEARDRLEKAREYGFYGPVQMRNLSQAYQGLGEYSRVIEIRKKVIEINPEPEDYSILARAYKETDQLKKSASAYENFIFLVPDRNGAYLDLGNIYREMEEREKAITAFEQGLKVSPGHFALRKALAETKFAIEEFESARKLFSGIVETHPHNYKAHHYLGQIEEEKGNYQKALDRYSEAIKYNSRYMTAYISRGKLFLEKEKLDQARQDFERLVEIDSNHYLGQHYLAETFYRLGDYETALERAEKAVNRNPEFEPALELREELRAIQEE